MTVTHPKKPAVMIDVDLPADFHEVPFGPSVEDRVYAQTRILDGLHIDNPVQREGVGWYLEALSRNIGEGTVAGSAFCAVRMDGEPSTAVVTLATCSTPADDPLVFVLGTCRALRRNPSYDGVNHERLGRTLAAVATGSTPNARHLTVVLPVAGQQVGVVLTLSTTDTAHAAVYEQVARDAAASVRVVG